MRGLVVPERTEDFTADPVELFFDLAFVFAFSQLVAVLLAEPNWTGIGKSAIVFSLLWLVWSQFTWSANAVSGNSRTVRILFLVATAASVPMAAAVSFAFDDGGGLFAIPLAIIFLAALAMMVLGHEVGSDEYRSSLNYSVPNIIAMAVIVIGGFVDGGARTTMWLAGIAVWLASTVFAGSGSWIIRAGHFAERHGLIIIVALGEVIVALGNAVVIPLRDGDGGLPAETVLALAAAGVFAALLWWSYFDRVSPAIEHRGEGLSAADRGRFARDVYTYDHLPIVAGVILLAVALEEMTLHPGDATPAAFRAMGAAGLAMFYGGVAVAVFRSFRAVAIERIVAVVVMAVIMGFASDVDGVWLVVVFVAVVFAALVAEHVRIEQPTIRRRGDTRSVDDGGVVDDAAHQPLEQPPAG